MEINVRKLSDVQVVQIRGALRLGTGVDNFRQTIDDALTAGDTRLVINFAEVPMIDSSGIGILVKAMASAKQRGGGVKLVTPSKFVVQTLKLIGVFNRSLPSDSGFCVVGRPLNNTTTHSNQASADEC